MRWPVSHGMTSVPGYEKFKVSLIAGNFQGRAIGKFNGDRKDNLITSIVQQIGYERTLFTASP